MKILIACEESQAVCKAFRAMGHEAYSCDIQDCSGGHPEWHIIGDAIQEAYSGKYDMMIAHPPCTYMSKAGARWMYPTAGNLSQTRFELAMEAKAFFDKLADAPIKYICLENPQPLKIVGLPPFTQAIQPYEYGHPYSKKTLLWLKELPKLKPTKIIQQYTTYLPSNTGGKKKGQKHNLVSISQKDSSKTFEGIATAMATQWCEVDKRHITQMTEGELKYAARLMGRHDDLFIKDINNMRHFSGGEIETYLKSIGVQRMYIYQRDCPK